MKALVVQNVSIEGPGLLQPAMEKAGWQLDIHLMDRPGARLPRSLSGYRALVVLGGPMNVYEEEDYPYLRQAGALIREAVSSHLPVLGICLGGQLIAKALDAPVKRNSVQEIGWYPVRLTAQGKESPLFAGLPEIFPVFQWHGDTFALPEGAALLASSRDCAHQAFSFGRSVYALQFHLEITPAIIQAWAEAYADELEEFGGPGAAGRLVAETEAIQAEYQNIARRFLDNWMNVLSRQ